MVKQVVCLIGICLLLGVAVFAEEPLHFVFTNYVPANYQSDTGEFKGFLVDIVVEALQNRMNIPVEMSIFPWKRCQSMVADGEADMITTIPTPERATYTVTHEKPIWIKQWRLYTYTGHPGIETMNAIKSIDDLKHSGFSEVSYIGNGWSETMIEAAGIPVVNANTVEGMYKMLAEQRGDVLIEDTVLALPTLKSLQLVDKLIPTEGVVSESNFHILIGKKSPYADIVPQLNQVIEAMWQDGTIQNILAEYTK